MNNHTEWKMRMADRTCEKVLKTIDQIMEDSNGHLDGDELDRLKDCWKILHCLQEMK